MPLSSAFSSSGKGAEGQRANGYKAFALYPLTLRKRQNRRKGILDHFTIRTRSSKVSRPPDSKWQMTNDRWEMTSRPDRIAPGDLSSVIDHWSFVIFKKLLTLPRPCPWSLCPMVVAVIWRWRGRSGWPPQAWRRPRWWWTSPCAIALRIQWTAGWTHIPASRP